MPYNGDERETVGWKISQVEQLIGLSRRDIQRACYSGKEDTDIMVPKDVGWGHRIYGKEDLAALLVFTPMEHDAWSRRCIQEKFLCALDITGVDLAIDIWLGVGANVLCALFNECLDGEWIAWGRSKNERMVK